jgi:tetratricopeptide (TPR) repeat protein
VRGALIGLALAAAVMAVFAPVRHYDFGDFDDRAYVIDNTEVTRGLTWDGVAWAFTSMQFANWFPLTWLSYMADVELFGADPGKHHVINVLFHSLNTLLLFGWLARVTRSIGPSAFVAALFAVHPQHVEAVAWIAQRKELLCTFFWLLTMWAYVFYAERPQLRRFLLVLTCFALGLMAKPMLVTLPFALLLLDIWPLGRAARSGWLELIREKLPLLVLSLASSVVTFVAQQHGGAVARLGELPVEQRLANVSVSYVTYIAKTIWPTRLAIHYPYPQSLPEWQVLGAVLLLIGLSALVLRAAREHRYLLVGWLWYLGTLVPVIGLVQVGSSARGDRYTYVPLIGLFIIVAWGARDLASGWAHRKWLLQGGATLAVVACAVTARAQVAHWRDPVTVWTRAIAVSGDDALAHNNLGAALGFLGKRDEAFAHYAEAARIHPGYADAHYNLANQLLDRKQFAQARHHYFQALLIDPDRANARFGLAICLVAEGKLAAAVREMTHAVRLEPGNANLHFNLAVMLLGQGKREAAANHLETALALDPNHSGARRELEALRRDPAHP